MTNNAVCKTKGTALSILETIMENIKSDTQKAALKAVAAWIQESNFDDEMMKMTHEEREAKITEILTHMRDCMSAEERREQAAFYLEGIEKLEAYGKAGGVIHG